MHIPFSAGARSASLALGAGLAHAGVNAQAPVSLDDRISAAVQPYSDAVASVMF